MTFAVLEQICREVTFAALGPKWVRKHFRSSGCTIRSLRPEPRTLGHFRVLTPREFTLNLFTCAFPVLPHSRSHQLCCPSGHLWASDLTGQASGYKIPPRGVFLTAYRIFAKGVKVVVLYPYRTYLCIFTWCGRAVHVVLMDP